MTQPRIKIQLTLALAVAGLLAAACGGPSAEPAPAAPPKVAFFEDLSVPDTLDTVLPASLSMQAFLRAETDAGRTASFQLVPFDTGGDPSLALRDVKTVAADPSYVAAVAAPFWIEPAAVADTLGAAGIPVINLSAVGRPGAASAGWVSLVADLEAQTRALAALATAQAGSGSVCEGQDGTPWAHLVARGVSEAAPGMHPTLLPLDDASAAAGIVSRRGCRVVLWAGFAPDAEELRTSLPSSVEMVGADGMKTWSYLAAAPVGTSSLVACSCADVNTSIEPAVQSFINGYQVATGLTPGVYAAEAWDAGGILDGLLRADVSRAAVDAGIARLRTYPGVAATYRFEPAVPLPARAFRGVGSRWILLGG